MVALKITSMKQFMNKLLASDAFDSFLLEEATISTSCVYHIDGRINKEFPDVPAYDFKPWEEAKGTCFDLIKGKHTPLFFKFVLHLKPEQTTQLLEQNVQGFDPSLLRAFVLTIKYDGEAITLTSGTAYTTFVLDKSPELLWDKALEKFLTHKEIAYENQLG